MRSRCVKWRGAGRGDAPAQQVSPGVPEWLGFGPPTRALSWPTGESGQETTDGRKCALRGPGESDRAPGACCIRIATSASSSMSVKVPRDVATAGDAPASSDREVAGGNEDLQHCTSIGLANAAVCAGSGVETFQRPTEEAVIPTAAAIATLVLPRL